MEFIRIIRICCLFIQIYFEQLCNLYWSLLSKISDKSVSNCIQKLSFVSNDGMALR